jgi:hypothetical protein
MKTSSYVLCATLVAGGCIETEPDLDPVSASEQLAPAADSDDVPKVVMRTRDALVREPLATGNGISYHGGPTMTSGANVYIIWYGSWSSNAKTILTNLAQHLGGTSYYNINTSYTNGSGTHLANVVTYKSSTTDNYSKGKSLSDSAIRSLVSGAISSGKLPSDTKGVYFVLTATDVNETSGMCSQYCGWHTSDTIGGKDIKYAFVGNAGRCLSSCAAQSKGPNGDAGADGTASIFAHELEEAATDPDINAWYDSQGEENADKCAWTFGSQSTASNGAKYNLTIGGRPYLIQQNWVNASGGHCAKSY